MGRKGKIKAPDMKYSYIAQKRGRRAGEVDATNVKRRGKKRQGANIF